MRTPPLGPDGIRARMEQIRAKLEAAFPARTPEPSGLTGQIGSDGTIPPMNPLGMSIQPNDPQIKGMIERAATGAGIDPVLFDALVASESAYDPNARSRAGAMGLSQLMPGTARSLGVGNPFDPIENLRGGATYLAQMLKRFGDPKLALAAYNAGPGAVERAGGVPNYKETRAYVDKVMRLYELRRSR